MRTKIILCQVRNPHMILPCPERVDGFRCERIEPHVDHHWLGTHTVLHNIAGSTVSCAEIEPTMTDETTELTENVNSNSSTFSSRQIAALVASAVILAVLMAFGVHWYASRNTVTFNGQGAIQAVNDDIETYTGQEISSANVAQKALGTAGKASDPPAFIFDNGKKSNDRETLDLYVDFGNSRSRDIISLNQSLLKSLVESGRVELRIHAVPSGSAFSLYAAEALAETFYLKPSRAWPTLLAILKLADADERDEYTAKTLASKLASVVKAQHVKGIDRQSIQNGTFASWLLSVGNDAHLKSGVKLPSLFLNNGAVNLPSVDLSSNTTFNKMLESHE